MPQRVLIEIARASDIKARGLQRLRDQAGIVGGCVECTGLISGVADHQCDALFSLRRVGCHEQRGECKRKGDQGASA